jgi:hypothetical protein
MDETTLTTAEKIAAIETSGLQIAYNDCHKIYLLDTDETEAVANGYNIYPASLIRDIIWKSCPLVFVSAWSLSDSPWTIEQCTDDIFGAARAVSA